MSNRELMNLLVPFLLFILLTPGQVLTLPSNSSRQVEKTITHALVFVGIYALLRTLFAKYY